MYIRKVKPNAPHASRVGQLAARAYKRRAFKDFRIGTRMHDRRTPRAAITFQFAHELFARINGNNAQYGHSFRHIYRRVCLRFGRPIMTLAFVERLRNGNSPRSIINYDFNCHRSPLFPVRLSMRFAVVISDRSTSTDQLLLFFLLVAFN